VATRRLTGTTSATAPRRRRALLATTLALSCASAACAPPPAAPPREAAAGTPAARIAAESFAAVLGPADGGPLGAAVGVAPGRALTSAHVVRAAAAALAPGQSLRLQRGDGRAEAPARVLATSPRLDLAVLEVPEGFLTPAAIAPAPPRPGEPVWALGPHRLGRSLAAGRVLRGATAAATPGPPGAVPGGAEGFVARMPALMGFSGGPVVDAAGRLAGLTEAALDETLGAHLLALVSGTDLAGLAPHGEARRILVLSIGAAQAEAARLEASGGAAR
jgi:S1-C subfamily serine protease